MSPAQVEHLAPTRFSVGGRTIEVAVRRSIRARYAHVVVGPARPVEVVLPQGMPERRVAEILAEKHDWIARQLLRIETREQRGPMLGLDRPDVVWVHGEAIPIESSYARSDGSSARLESGRLLLRSAPLDGHSRAEAEAAVLRWYRREARERVSVHVAAEADQIGVSPRKVSIRDPKTRWGSCSSRATLSFSWRLLLAPFDVFDYVVVHELCHLRELNHSSAFWELVKNARPQYRVQYEWLAEHGEELLSYTPALSGP